MSDDDLLSRRKALQGLSVGIGLAAAGCGGSSTVSTAEAAPAPTPSSSSTSVPPTKTADPSTPPAPPATTEPEPPLTPKQLLAGIDHVVVLMMENRSFDHFLGTLKSDAGYAAKATVEGLSGTETNPAPDGSMVASFKMDNFTPEDLPHSWEEAHAQWNNGLNDGFVTAHAGDSQNEAMGFHDRSQIPFYYWLADNFAICDHWFASVMGPTWPNRYYLHAATSKGKNSNTPFITGAPDTIWDRLKAKGLTYKNYYAGITSWYLGGFVGKILSMNPSARIDDFFEAAEQGKLPAFSLIDPDFQASDDHPDHNIQRGQAFVSSVYKALAESPAWSKTLFIITYDEHGGFFDHVPPPVAKDDDADFQHYGFRVPAFVIGPTVKKGYVSKTVYDHASVGATLRTRFDITDLTTRMTNAVDISDCIDPAKVKAPAAPPTGMPQTVMSLQTALYDRVGVSSQPELQRMVDTGVIPKLDPRSHEERIGAWLKHAQRLGAVRVL